MRQFNPDTDCMLVVDNHHGRCIPYVFCQQFEEQLEAAGLEIECNEILLTVDTEREDWQSYDDSWLPIMDNYIHEENDREWTLMNGPCGDLFLVATDVELPDWE